MKHLSESELSAVVDRALPERSRAAAERHLAECEECRAALARLAAQDLLLARALKRDPGEAYFASFADRVQDRLRAAVAERDPETPATAAAAERADSPLERLGRWFTGPRLGWLGTAAALVVGAGVVLVVSHEAPIEKLREPQSMAHGPVAQPPRAAAPSPASGRVPEAGARPGAGAPGAASAPSRNAVPSTRGAPPSEAPSARARGTAGPRAFAGPPSPNPQATTGTLAGSSSGATSPARMREVRHEGGEDVPVAGAMPSMKSSSTSSDRALTTGGAASALTSRQRRAKQAEIAAPLGVAPQAAAENARAPVENEARALERDQGARIHVCGKVRDESGRGIAGAQVAAPELGLSAAADPSGMFCVDLPPGECTLTVMAIGFREGYRTLNVDPGIGEQTVILEAVPVMGGNPAPAGRLSAGAPPEDAWPALLRPLAMTAERQSDLAAQHGRAADYDRAAESWERLAVRVGHDANGLTARRQAARLRYHAWELAPTAARRSAAIAALELFLEVAPTNEAQAARAQLAKLRRK